MARAMRDTRVALAVLLATACGGTDSEIPDPPAGLEVSWTMDDCAPWDGAATMIYLAGAMTDDPFTAPYPHVWVSLYYPRSELPGRTLRWNADELNVGGAMRCVAERECEAASQALVRVRRQAADSVALAGDIHLEFPNGETVEGIFRAVLVERTFVCG